MTGDWPDMRLTKRTVDAQKPKKSEYWVADDALSGFGLRIFPSGAKSFVYRYRWHGERRIKVIGLYGKPHGTEGKALTADQARKQAEILHGLVRSGTDPNSTAKWGKDAPTVTDLCDSYLNDVKSGKVLTRAGRPKSKTTISTDEGRIERHIKPLLGKKMVKNVTRKDIEKFRDAVTAGATRKDVKTGKHGRAIVKGGSGTATRTIGLLGAIFAYAERNMMREGNPVYGVQRASDQKKLRSLSQKDYAAIGKAIREIRKEAKAKEKKQPGSNTGTLISLDAIEVLLLTGCRKAEILSLKKTQIDQTAHCLRLAETKTGPQIRPIGAAALKHLMGLKWKGDYVFPATRGKGYIVGVPKVWERVRRAAKLPDVSLHTFRHGFASVAAEMGYSELTIAGLLGHRSNTVTGRYIHLVDPSLVAAADRVSCEIDASMARKRRGRSNVVQMKRRK